MNRTVPHRLARLMVRVATLRAPTQQQDRMTREWDGEIDREFDAGGGWNAVAAARGAFADAKAMRHLERREEGTMTVREWMGLWRSDVALAIRGLWRAPGFTAVAVFTLAIGLGGSAAIYTLLDRVVLDPLPYPDSERLVRLENQVPGVGPDERWALSTAQFVYFTDNSETLADVGLYRSGGGNIMTASGPQRARTVAVTASMMSLLGAQALHGRLITPADDEPSAAFVGLLSHGFWTRVLGGDPSVVGATLSVDGAPIEVVGVLDPGLELPGWTPAMAPDVWMPMRLNRNGGFGNSHVFPAVGKLVEGATPESVEAEMERLTARLPEAFPNVYSQGFFDQYGFRTMVTPLKESVIGDMAHNLWILFGGVGLVLLIACANVTNLFLVRVEGKRRELEIRTALGADGWAIGRYLLSEALTMTLIGGALALVVVFWAVPALIALAPEELPRVKGVGVDASTLLFTAALSVVLGVVVAAFPILGRGSSVASLTGSGRGSTAGPRRQRMRSALVVSQMALAVTLIVGAGLLVESLRALHRTDTGMDAEGVVAVNLYMNPHRYQTDLDLWNVYREIVERVGDLPGVVSVGLGEEVPVSGGYECTVQGFEDETVYDRVRQAGTTTCAGQERVTPGYFETLDIPVLEGRTLGAGDHADPTRAAVVVSKAFAERFWPGESAIGKGVGPSGRTAAPFYRVVGVVGDVAQRSAEGQPPLSQNAMAIYYPIVHNPDATGNWGWWWAGDMTLVVKTDGDDPTSIFPALRRTVAEIDPEAPLANVRAMEDVVDGAMADVSFISLLLGIAAAVALTLAAVGLYGVIAYVVSQRTREIGMRLAIGAQPVDVLRSVVGRTLALVAMGLLLGIPLAAGASRVSQGILVGVEPTDPTAYAIAAALLTVVALAASWLPARRAASVDPVTALRAE